MKKKKEVSAKNLIAEYGGKEISKSKGFNKDAHINIDDIDFKELDYKRNFLYNDLYEPVRKLINKDFDKYFDRFFNGFIISVPNKEDRLEDKKKIRNMFYHQFYERVSNDNTLIASIKLLYSSYKGNDIVSKVCENISKENLLPIIKEMFSIPNLMILAYDKNPVNFKKLLSKIENDNKEKKIKIENMVDTYLVACEKYMNDNPTREMLEKISGVKSSIWKKQMANSIFLFALLKKIDNKKEQAKSEENIKLWEGVRIIIDKKFDSRLFREPIKKKATSEYDANISYCEVCEEEFEAVSAYDKVCEKCS